MAFDPEAAMQVSRLIEASGPAEAQLVSILVGSNIGGLSLLEHFQAGDGLVVDPRVPDLLGRASFFNGSIDGPIAA